MAGYGETSRETAMRVSAIRRGRFGLAPAERATAAPPDARATAIVPSGDPLAQSPPPRTSHAPPLRPVGKPPNPRRPPLVMHVNGGGLQDLFQIFPDLPRPPRPTGRSASRLRDRRTLRRAVRA